MKYLLLILLVTASCFSCTPSFLEGNTTKRCDLYGIMLGDFMRPELIALNDETGNPDLDTMFILDSIFRIRTRLKGIEEVTIDLSAQGRVFDMTHDNLSADQANLLLEHFKDVLGVKPSYSYYETKDSLGEIVKIEKRYKWSNIQIGDYYNVHAEQEPGHAEVWEVYITNIRVKDGSYSESKERKKNKKKND